MERCDALIVGGGPAGSTVARALARSGLEVSVLDKAEFPRDKVCAGWITPAVLSELGLEPEEYARSGRTLQAILGFRVGRMGGELLDFRYGAPVSYGILRCELDEYLLRRSGARLRLGTPLHQLERKRDTWIVNGEIETPLVVGAGGHFCPVARHLLGGGRLEEPIVAAQELEIELSQSQAERCAVEPEVPELYFADDLRGYGWCFRKGGYLNVGLGRQDRSGLRGHVKDFVARLREWGRLPADLDGPFKGHAYLIYGQAERPVVADGVLLVGDAAGLAYPASGEGIRPAVESGLLAARVILEARSYRASELERYRTLLEQRFTAPRLPVWHLLPESWRRLIARRLLDSRWFAQRVLLEHWFLHRDQEPLAASDVPTPWVPVSESAGSLARSIGDLGAH